MQFIVIAYDGTDADAPGRRMAARDEHLKLGKEMYDAGRWLFAVGILDNVGAMIGSMIVCEFPSQEELEKQWLRREPYVVGQVWRQIDIRRARTAPFIPTC